MSKHCVVAAIFFCLLGVCLAGDVGYFELIVQYPEQNINANAIFTVRGDLLGLNWGKGAALHKSGKDSWNIRLNIDSDSVAKIMSLKFLINDVDWQIGANSQVKILNSSMTATFYPFFYSYTGIYKIHPNVFSPQLNNTRDLIIYTPPSYYENTLKPMTNVLIMHDGENLFNDSTSFAGIAWRCQNTINIQVAEGSIDEVFILGVYNTIDRIDEYTYSVDPTVGQGGKGDLYLNFLLETVVPYTKKLYPRIQTNRENLGILGSSLGGLISCYAGWTRSKMFGKAGCMSSSFWWNSEDFNNTILTKFSAPDDLTVYLDSGNAGPDNDDVTQTQTVRNHINALGYVMGKNEFYYLDNGGQHGEKYWGARFYVPMQDLYPPSLTPALPV